MAVATIPSFWGFDLNVYDTVRFNHNSQNVDHTVTTIMATNKICIISRRVKIPKRHLTLDKVSSDLILRDSRPAEYASREPFVCFKDGGDGYIVPKMYGVNFIQVNNLPFEDRQKDGESVPQIAFSGSLREPQVDPVEKTIRALETKQGGVMSLYCGFGKTTCSLKISCHFKKKRSFLCTPPPFSSNGRKELSSS